VLITDNSEPGLAVVVAQGGELPRALRARLQLLHLTEVTVDDGADAVSAALRSHPTLIVIDGRGDPEWRTSAIEACTTIKGDSYSGIIPLVAVADPADLGAFFLAGADEVVHDGTAEMEVGVRVSAALVRNERDTDVHPSTRLPGTRRIEAELRRRIEAKDGFAVCYVDLDHFKEFNDRYGWHNGDQVIRLLARILHDVVKGLCVSDGFVGHIGGDDFLCVVPLDAMPRVCDEIVQVFDELIPLQYSEQDRRAGYFFGKDRRGQLHRVPLMTLSIGVASNQRRHFMLPAEVSELASEMKSYAKTLTGSVWAVDRRRDDDPAVKSVAAPSAASAPPVSSLKVGNSR
jgi:diguanylate cyclase (GGDEF)-like protein